MVVPGAMASLHVLSAEPVPRLVHHSAGVVRRHGRGGDHRHACGGTEVGVRENNEQPENEELFVSFVNIVQSKVVFVSFVNTVQNARFFVS